MGVDQHRIETRESIGGRWEVGGQSRKAWVLGPTVHQLLVEAKIGIKGWGSRLRGGSDTDIWTSYTSRAFGRGICLVLPGGVAGAVVLPN